MAASGSTAADPYDLQRFIAGLGHSATAQKYAVLTLDEAKAYLNHPVLGNRQSEFDAQTIKRLAGAIALSGDAGQ
jgi:uncharacterized protein (DUF1810 family)